MPRITYVSSDGAEESVVDAPVGITVMKAAVSEGVRGIVAECGGNLMCATCHVYVDPAWAARLPESAPDEDEMLEVTFSERRATSRLSCQLTVTEEFDGLVVQLPPSQC